MMPILVDTSVWSLALRRRRKDLSKSEQKIVAHLEEILILGEAVLPGVVRQEVLTGIRKEAVFEALSNGLRDFDDVPMDIEDFERAARFANACRLKGIAAPVADMMICSLANGHDWRVFTTDQDFSRYARCVDVLLHDFPGD